MAAAANGAMLFKRFLNLFGYWLILVLICGYAVNFNSAAVVEVFSFFHFKTKKNLCGRWEK